MSAVCDGVTLRSHCTGGPGGELPSAIVHNIKTIEQKNVFFFDFASLFDSRFCRFSVYRFQFRSSKVYKKCTSLKAPLAQVRTKDYPAPRSARGGVRAPGRAVGVRRGRGRGGSGGREARARRHRRLAVPRGRTHGDQRFSDRSVRVPFYAGVLYKRARR